MNTSSVFIASRYCVLLLLLSGCAFEPGWSLQWAQFRVPEWVRVGEDTLLTCEFDLQGDPLYSVTWYRAGREIYRYVPAANPPQGAFMMPGVVIDENKSDDQHLALKKVDFNTSGRFKCEVLTDSPFFKTLVKSDPLQVVDLPEGSPVLVGAKAEYQIGELINITCSTTPSVPPVVLTWYINDREATAAELAPRPYYHLYSLPEVPRPTASTLRLEFISRRSHFHHGVVTFLCRARIKGLHDSRVVHTARESSGLRPSLLEGPTSGGFSAWRFHISVLVCVRATLMYIFY